MILYSDHPNYDNIIKLIKLNKPFLFTIEYSIYKNKLLDAQDVNLHRSIIKIIGYDDLTNEYASFKNCKNIIYEGDCDKKLIISDTNLLERCNTYNIGYKLFFGGLYQIVAYTKIKNELQIL